ncbi:MAG: ThiF family adenylyltransferase, partial [Deltaproteobacteria bacterium]|nr:ThiF family adenylyltransferase [Deltaproteobacteria bacterium]
MGAAARQDPRGPGYPFPPGGQVPLHADAQARYSRHLLLPEVGPAGQDRLTAARVLVVGAGGLGSPALLYLAAAGVGTLGIADGDRVELSNLQRQVIHSRPGDPKTGSAAARIAALNPLVRVVEHPALDASNALDVLRGYDLVLDGSDNFPTRYLLDDATAMLGIPLVSGSVYKFEGQVSVFNHAGGPGYRDLFPEPPPPGSVPTCGEAGVLGVVPGLVGMIQATEALKLLLGIGSPLAGRLLVLDALDMSTREVAFSRDPARPVPTALIDYPAWCGVPAARVPELAPSELDAKWAAGWDPYVIDVRRPAEVADGVLPRGHAAFPHD